MLTSFLGDIGVGSFDWLMCARISILSVGPFLTFPSILSLPTRSWDWVGIVSFNELMCLWPMITSRNFRKRLPCNGLVFSWVVLHINVLEIKPVFYKEIPDADMPGLGST
jgi:hypothetical protein